MTISFRLWSGLFCGFYGVAFAFEEVEKTIIAGQVAGTYHHQNRLLWHKCVELFSPVLIAPGEKLFEPNLFLFGRIIALFDFFNHRTVERVKVLTLIAFGKV